MEKELAISIPDPSVEGRVKIRIVKVVWGHDSSTYLILLPGVAPAGFKLSFHPTGEVHLKTRDHGVIARANLLQALAAIDVNRVYRLAQRLLVAPHRRRATFGLIFPHKAMLPLLTWNQGSVDLQVDQLVGQLQPVRLGDTRHLGGQLRDLRTAGLLAPFDILMIEDGRRDAQLLFFNLASGRAPEFPREELPPDFPLKQAFNTAMGQIEEFGGVMVEMPEGRKFDRIVRYLGFGPFLDAVKELDRVFELPGQIDEMETKLEPAIKALDSFTPSFRPLPLIRTRRLRVSGSQSVHFHSLPAHSASDDRSPVSTALDTTESVPTLPPSV